MSNYIYIPEIDTYVLKSSIEYLTIKGNNLCIGNGKSNYSIQSGNAEGAEARRSALLAELTT